MVVLVLKLVVIGHKENTLSFNEASSHWTKIQKWSKKH